MSDETQVFRRFVTRRFNSTLLDRVLRRLRDEQIESGKTQKFELLQQFLSVNRETANYAKVSEQLGMEITTVRMATHRMRQRYRALLREEISHTLVNPDEIEDELNHLFKVLVHYK